jgi:hypothetical protein
MTDTELRGLLLDCLALWGVRGRVLPACAGVAIVTVQARFRLQPAPAEMRPVRWLLHRPDGRQRVAPSIGAALVALRNALGVETGNRIVIGTGATAP